jgi:RHS repeat-associated protein
VSSGENDILTTAYAYLAAANQNETTTLISALTNSGVNWSETLNYTYDALGNIETISEGNTQKAKYYYDGLNQLIREDNAWLGKTVAYTYDNGGNILLVEEYTLTSGALDGLTANNSYTYLYGDSNWKDKLTSYDGKAITYDSIGNRTSYDGYSYTWQAGRELAGISGNGLAATYKYDADGIRTEKTVNGVTTGYTLEGANVLKEVAGEDTIWYDYDAAGNILAMTLNGTTYYYEKNVQGDIIGIIDDTGAKVVEYTYDSWGKIISTTGTLSSTVGVKNPYRYRGYRYDAETGLYYLQSRYYDAAMGRFVNADNVFDQNAKQFSYNLFHYCANNPANNLDSTGHWVLSVGVEGGAAFVFGLYAAVGVNYDGKRVSISFSAGILIITNAAWSISGYMAYYPKKTKVSQVNGWGVSVGAAFSVGAHFGAGGGFEMQSDAKNGFSASLGGGASIAPIPYFQVKFGYTWTLCSTTIKKLKAGIRYIKGRKAVKITKNPKYLNVYVYSAKKNIRIYYNKKRAKVF